MIRLHTIPVRLNRWAKAGVLERLAAVLQREVLAEVVLDTLALDSTIVKFHGMGPARPRKRAPGDRTLAQPAPGLNGGRPDLQTARGRGWRAHPAGALALICSGGRLTGRSRPAERARSC